jgi:diguanylate cyclase (GGDEF)-like protein
MSETPEFYVSSTLLIIGDDKRDCSELQQLLDSEMELTYAEDADQVIEITSDGEPLDLVLVDVASLNGNAFETCMWLKTDNEVKHIPIIVIGSESEDVSSWLNAGASDFVSDITSPQLGLARVKSQLELKNKTDLLTTIASLDGLTTLCNKQRMDEYLDIEWRRSLREYYPLSLIKIDVDQFTAFNDHYGIGCGNDCLKRIARVLKENCLRAADMVSRYSADEFMVLLPGIELDNALKVAERMVEAVAGLAIGHDNSDVADYVTISAGLATVEPTRDKRYQDLFDEIDEVLYGAQQSGGNQAQGVSI